MGFEICQQLRVSYVYVAVWCNVLQCGTVRCGVVQYGAVCVAVRQGSPWASKCVFPMSML